jgi:RHS repeat-associated protein
LQPRQRSDRRFTTVYDAGGLPVRTITPGDVTGGLETINRTFDALGQVRTEIPSNGAGKGFNYDRLGRVITASHPSGNSLSFTYDDRNLLIAAGGGAGVASFSYFPDGAPKSRTDVTGTANFTYEATTGRLKTISDSQSAVTREYGYDSYGRMNALQYQLPASGGTASRTFSYEATSGRLDIDEQRDATQAIVYRTDYGYDADGRVTSEALSPGTVAGAGTTTYAYNASSQLLTWSGPGAGTGGATGTTNYTYDRAGNRTTAGAKTLTYDNRNRLTTQTGGPTTTTTTWTPRGTMKTLAVSGTTTQNLTFDSFGRVLTKGATTYTYDALDRIATRNGTAQFAYAGKMMDPSSDGTTTISRDGSGPLSIKTAGIARVTSTDRHGDVTRLLNPTNGSVSDTTSFDPYGVKASTTGSTVNPIGFQGDWTDPTTTDVWMGARFYTPGLASFISRDTYSDTLTSPVSLNRYTYGANNPIKFFDPSGHKLTETADGKRHLLTRPTSQQS